MRTMFLVLALALLTVGLAEPAAASPPCDPENPCDPQPLLTCGSSPDPVRAPTAYAKWLLACV